ncbi:(2Fe-2S)-binding protein [Alkalicoccus chagannorensis]|uniref:(2Fe-2S)-binding protein n=1 Tax=Alkalicoccus chagannorensis TaxID=427072 RepID=UPI00042875BB|nr:2Fe-2S iron-sulfur cluster-binding protein [Alkalicoccus chagannorensis]
MTTSMKTTPLEINGTTYQIEASPSRRLVDILRHDLRLTGTKVSCEVGRCGACMVLVDDVPHNSCLLMMYQCEGRRIETVESFPEEDALTQAFVEEGALQCGYCTPGMMISLRGLLRSGRAETKEALMEGLSGNICRCTGYGGIHRVLDKITEEGLS